jgi:hypothetical protein
VRNPATDDLATLRRALGNPGPPAHLWQREFDHDPGHLKRIVALGSGQRADPVDLVDYALDLTYEEVQGDLLRYALPLCLQAWREDLLGRDKSYGGFVEHLYPALARVFDRVLEPADTTAVAAFMRAALLEEMDEQRGLAFTGMGARPYRWFYALGAYGVILPDIPQLWTAWWSLGSVGRAIAAVQYGSCLLYGQMDNPVFTPWTRVGGGGPPPLWEFEGHLYRHRWQESNGSFLREALTPEAVLDVLRRAVFQLKDLPERAVAAQVLKDASAREAILGSRCAELPRILERAQGPGDQFEWSL